MSRYLRRVLARSAGRRPPNAVSHAAPLRFPVAGADPFAAAEAPAAGVWPAGAADRAGTIGAEGAALARDAGAPAPGARSAAAPEDGGTRPRLSRSRRVFDDSPHLAAARTEAHGRDSALPAPDAGRDSPAQREAHAVSAATSQREQRVPRSLSTPISITAPMPALPHEATSTERPQAAPVPSAQIVAPPGTRIDATRDREPGAPLRIEVSRSAGAGDAIAIAAPASSPRAAPPVEASPPQVVIGRVSVVVESARPAASGPRPAPRSATTAARPAAADGLGLSHRFGLGQL